VNTHLIDNLFTITMDTRKNEGWRQSLNKLPSRFIPYLNVTLPNTWKMADFIRSLNYTKTDGAKARMDARQLLWFLRDSNVQILRNCFGPLRREYLKIKPEELQKLLVLVDPISTVCLALSFVFRGIRSTNTCIPFFFCIDQFDNAQHCYRYR
jgi:hypothetical protein